MESVDTAFLATVLTHRLRFDRFVHFDLHSSKEWRHTNVE
jgi:hypothetical protein